jgi:hypothetical protein
MNKNLASMHTIMNFLESKKQMDEIEKFETTLLNQTNEKDLALNFSGQTSLLKEHKIRNSFNTVYLESKKKVISDKENFKTLKLDAENGTRTIESKKHDLEMKIDLSELKSPMSQEDPHVVVI